MDREPKDVEHERILKGVSVDVTNITRTSRMIHNSLIYTPGFNITPQAPTKKLRL